MAEYRIQTPVQGYNGVSASLLFINGEAVTDDESLVKWFVKKGYIVEEIVEDKPEQIITKTKKSNKKKDGGIDNDNN